MHVLYLGVLPGNAQELLQHVILVSHVKVIAVPPVVILIEHLWWQHIPLALLLLPMLPHEVPVLLHARCRDVHHHVLHTSPRQNTGYPLLLARDLSGVV